ncbi:MAG: sirohydrochlorin cobaltochelatase, partial [Clostridiales bacterium]
SCLTVANPLLTKTEDYVRLAEILNRAYAVENGEALVLMGHGTSHGANAAYPAFDYICRDKGYRHIFIGTVEGYPCKQDVIRRVNEAGFTRVLLAPLMLVAGDHAVNDMAGAEPESWKNSFAARGYQVRCLIRGLGELAEVRQLYRDHLSAVLTEQNQEING